MHAEDDDDQDGAVGERVAEAAGVDLAEDLGVMIFVCGVVTEDDRR